MIDLQTALLAGVAFTGCAGFCGACMIAASWRGAALAKDVRIRRLLAQRDEARQELTGIQQRRSRAISQGNRTRAAKRRLALPPPLTTEITTGDAGTRAELTG